MRNLYFRPKHSPIREMEYKLNLANIATLHRANRAHRAIDGAEVRLISRKEKLREAEMKHREN